MQSPLHEAASRLSQGKTTTTTKMTIPSCGVGEGGKGGRGPGIWFSALRTGLWTRPSRKQQLSVT